MQSGLFKLGFPSDQRAFTPHLTLGRVRREADAQQRSMLGRALQALRLEPLVWQPTQLCLYRSELLSTGPRYTQLESLRLQSHH